LIKKYRFDHYQMTQEKTDDALNGSRQTIIAIENGKFNPSVKQALKMAKLFKCQIEYFLHVVLGGPAFCTPILNLNFLRYPVTHLSRTDFFSTLLPDITGAIAIIQYIFDDRFNDFGSLNHIE